MRVRAVGLLRRVLDVGCGTGEHALMAAAMGLGVPPGVDDAAAAAVGERAAAPDRDEPQESPHATGRGTAEHVHGGPRAVIAGRR